MSKRPSTILQHIDVVHCTVFSRTITEFGSAWHMLEDMGLVAEPFVPP